MCACGHTGGLTYIPTYRHSDIDVGDLDLGVYTYLTGDIPLGLKTYLIALGLYTYLSSWSIYIPHIPRRHKHTHTHTYLLVS